MRRLIAGHHDVVVVTSAADALLRLAADDRFDAVLCDLMMPDMTGMELFAEVQQRLPAYTERFVFMTGGPFTPMAREFLDTLGKPCLDKPFDAIELLDALSMRIA